MFEQHGCKLGYDARAGALPVPQRALGPEAVAAEQQSHHGSVTEALGQRLGLQQGGQTGCNRKATFIEGNTDNLQSSQQHEGDIN